MRVAPGLSSEKDHLLNTQQAIGEVNTTAMLASILIQLNFC